MVAPDREQSGVGTAITLAQPLRVTEIPPHVEGVPTYAVEGTPSDSAIVALQTLIEEPVDLVVSGINKGANMGNDVFISGTMGAALQAHFRGIPAIAISVAALRDIHFDAAAQVARLLAQNVADGTLTAPLLLNVNLPNLPPERIRGVSLTRLGRRTYMDVVNEGDDGRRKYYWIARGQAGMGAGARPRRLGGAPPPHLGHADGHGPDRGRADARRPGRHAPGARVVPAVAG